MPRPAASDAGLGRLDVRGPGQGPRGRVRAHPPGDPRARPVEQFHGQSELLVQQELSAHFSLIAMTRLFTNHSEGGYRSDPGKPALQANFRNGLRTVGRHLEGLFLHYAATLDATLREILDSIAPCRQRRRPNRSYPRVSRKPASKWRSRKPTPTATPA